MVETGDEVLDYRHAVEKYRGAQHLVIKGGDHGFSDFGDYLDQVMEFLRRPRGISLIIRASLKPAFPRGSAPFPEQYVVVTE